MAAVDTGPGVFRLPPLDLPPPDASSLPTLPEVQPRFVLPLLDEYASGTERLLGSLRGVSGYALLPETPSKGRGKGKQRDLEPDTEEEGVDGADAARTHGEVSLWVQATSDEAGPSRPAMFQPLRSWDVLDSARADEPPLLSEGGTRLFEALIIASEPPLSIPTLRSDPPPHAIDTIEILDLMVRSTMGTVTTAHFRWEANAARFVWDMQGGRPEGLERRTAASTLEGFLSIATGLRRLEIIVDTQSVNARTPTHHALLHSLSTYLTFIKQLLSAAIGENEKENSAGYSKWSSALADVRLLLAVLCEVMCWPLEEPRFDSFPSRASSLLTHIYSHLVAHHSTASLSSLRGPVVLCLAYLLSRSSSPLLALLHQWVGLGDSDHLDNETDPESQPWSDLGITRKTVRGQPNKWEYDFSPRRMPGFIPRESRRTLFEAGRSLRLLREASEGQHPLCAGGWAIQARWTWGAAQNSSVAADLSAHSRKVQKEIDCWKRSTRDRPRPLSGSVTQARLRPHRKERKRLPPEFLDAAQTPDATENATEMQPEQDIAADPLWALFERPPGSHLASTTSDTLWAPNPLDELHDFISLHSHPDHPLLPPDSPTLPLYINNHLLAPLLTHSKLVSTALVSLYLDGLHLLDHLDVLRAYWLAGDVGFSERVSGALFGREVAGAGEALGLGRRARTRARLGLGGGEIGTEGAGEWGIGLGLGLSERARWPPGGAELAYALRTTLLGDEAPMSDTGPVWEKIEDRVSFAITPLPEGDADGKRAKWLDPQAIEALDFLYLAYSPSPSIGVLLPPSIMSKYQSIHNFLLRLSRVEVVLRSLAMDVLHPSDPFVEPIKLGVDSGLNRPPSRNGPVDHPERGMLSADPKLERLVQRLRFRMSGFVSSLSRYVVDTAIGTHWEVLRQRLEKLKRRTAGKQGSRPSSPEGSQRGEREADWWTAEDADDRQDEGDEGDEADDGAEEHNLHQLQSIHSLVLYHHVTLDKICRACLLAPHAGYEVTYKLLMTLFSLILDLGKAVKELERRLVAFEEAGERIREVAREWNEKEAVFLHALERLSLRSSSKTVTTDGADAAAEERDLQVLLGGEGRDEEDQAGQQPGIGSSNRRGAGDLQELLLRLRLFNGDGRRGGRYHQQHSDEAV